MKTEQKLFAVLDQGSSGSRAFIVNDKGEIVYRKHKELTASHKGPGMAEYDGNELLENQVSTLKEVLAQLAPGENVESISVTSQRSTIVLWDKETGLPVAPVLTWQDGRAAQIAQEVSLSQEKIHAITGLYKTPFYSAGKITWCLKNVPSAKEAADKGTLLIAPVASFIIWHLTNKKTFATDPTLAQRTLLFNINTFNWDKELADAFEVPLCALPEIKNTLDNYGSFDGVPIKVCAGDQQAATVGIGMDKEGDCCINYGTGAFLLVSTGSTLKNIEGLLTSVGPTTAQNTRNFILEGPVNAAGAIFQWLNSAGINFDLNDIDEMYSAAKNPVMFLPAFGGLGAPYWDFTVPTVISNLTSATKKEDFVAGAVRSLAFMIADIAFYLKMNSVVMNEVMVSGGFARNQSLLKFQSDILQQKLLLNTEHETTALGAMCLAAREARINTAVWDLFNAHKEYVPEITPQDAQALYARWHSFHDWCRHYNTNKF
ncbi:glycerol kinase [Elusimicrobium posterum]|uniref:FGGY family carbohydrate kinase n=1 Tax=Elusimicrobium posterum TaxID=3116653 RepID=UPI003C70EED0